jgi:phage gp46-like protein
MPGLDRVLDPITKDYVSDGAGSTSKTTSLMTQLHHQFYGRLDGWVGDPSAGSLLYKLERGRNSRAEADRAADYVRQAVQRFIDSGLASDLDVGVQRDGRGRWALYSSLRDLQSGAIIDLNPLLPYGV